jgi:aspartyl-tRNA(Asn)/glutamyl-tRNA(Gln) amidotransferase subunit A
MAGSRPTYEQTRAALRSGSTTVEKTVAGYLDATEEHASLNAFLHINGESALAQARTVDGRIASGHAGALAGMVVAVKDNICIRGERLTCGSKVLEDFVSPYDATVIERLRNADAVVIGKTNLDEFAMGSSTENSAFGPVRNPTNEHRVPGGSSGGSAVAVAAGMAHAALGSDTGGSIRQPAAFCGVVGMKPTYGRVSRYGLVALSSSFDQIGPFANSVSDVARVLQVISGFDARDSTSVRLPVPDYSADLNAGVRGWKIGVVREALGEGLQEEVRGALRQAMEAFSRSGALVQEISLPHSAYVISAYYVLMTAEASSNLARYDGVRYGHRAAGARDIAELYTRSRTEGFGSEVKRRIMLGTYVLSAGYYDAYYRKAQKVRRLIQDDFVDAFKTVDCLLLPVSPTTAFTIGEKTDSPLQMYLSDVFTVSANLAGIPAISVPFGKDRSGLPIGVQILGKQFDELSVLRAAAVLEGGNSESYIAASSTRPHIQ